MKIAIVIGVSRYDNLDNLYACKNDANLMKVLLDSTGEYDKILLINEKTNSTDIKDKLFGFIKEKKDEINNKQIELEEVLFYYSGHGTYRDEEFYYTTSDFNINKIRTTSIENTELDDALISLNPKLTIKIVDACESGTRYIKNVDDMNLKYLDNTKGKFNDCYFLYSSHSNQSSGAGKELSYFTHVFIESIINRNYGKIRYRDIADYISDRFEELNIKQKPYYVNQSSNTEQFCNITEDLKKNVIGFIDEIFSIENSETNGEESEDKGNKTLVEIIKEDAKNYCENLDEVINTLNEISLNLKSISLSFKDLDSLYKLNLIIHQDNLDEVSNIESVANSIKNKNCDYFVKYDYEERKFKKKVPIGLLQIQWLPEKDKYRYETEVKRVISGYQITEDIVPYDSIYIEMNPILPNLLKYTCCLVYAFSKSEITLFYCINRCYEHSWGIYDKPKNENWYEISCLIKDKERLKSIVEEIKEKFLQNIYNDLLKKFNYDEIES